MRPVGLSADQFGGGVNGITGSTVYVDKGYQAMGVAVDRPTLT